MSEEKTGSDATIEDLDVSTEDADAIKGAQVTLQDNETVVEDDEA